ncbi:beta-lactamase [Vibrio sp. VPAP30]|nr:beta-lactamase [Vibrio sp. VPAP30]
MNKLIKPLLTLYLLVPSFSFAVTTDFVAVEKAIERQEETLSARIGVAVLNVETGALWSFRGDERFPLTSTFKSIACAKLLYDADQKTTELKKTVTVNREGLVAYSPVLEAYIDKEITLGDACQATMLTSDNTAANIVIASVGGTDSITSFVRELGDENTRLDRVEPELNEALPNDPRDTTTPISMTNTLNELVFGAVLSENSRAQLIDWMKSNEVTGNLLRSVLPVGWEIADRSGAGGFGARSINAVVWLDKKSPIIVSIYVSQTDASMDQRNLAIVEIGKSIFDLFTGSTQQ